MNAWFIVLFFVTLGIIALILFFTFTRSRGGLRDICDAQNKCGAGLICTQHGAVSVCLGDQGAVCGNGSDCSSASCVRGRCTAVFGGGSVGQACSDSSGCSSGICTRTDISSYECRLGAEAVCQTDDQCTSGMICRDGDM